jgi:hypothetical protein
MIKRAGQLDAQGACHEIDRSGSNSKIKDLTPLLCDQCGSHALVAMEGSEILRIDN